MKQQIYLLIERYKAESGLTPKGIAMCLSNDTLDVLSLLEKI
jgi:hypothetical protein